MFSKVIALDKGVECVCVCVCVWGGGGDQVNISFFSKKTYGVLVRSVLVEKSALFRIMTG